MYCDVCELKILSRIYYCYFCKVCILKRDYYCFMVGICIGYKNQRYFVVMVFWIMVCGLFGGVFIFVYIKYLYWSFVLWIDFFFFFYNLQDFMVRQYIILYWFYDLLFVYGVFVWCIGNILFYIVDVDYFLRENFV